MQKITLDEYKRILLDYFYHECDNNETKRLEREASLSEHCLDDYLNTVIDGTYIFAEQILTLSEDNYQRFLLIPLPKKPEIKHISLHINGGFPSDIIAEDNDGNLYSITLLKRIFGKSLQIEPQNEETHEEWEGDVMSEISEFSIYIVCPKETIDKVRLEFKEGSNKTKILEIK